MAQKSIGVIMNGVSGGMGYRQHLLRNGCKTQWEQFLRHVVEDGPHGFDLLAGARGVRLAEAGLASSRSGTRVDLPELVLPDSPPVAVGAGR